MTDRKLLVQVLSAAGHDQAATLAGTNSIDDRGLVEALDRLGLEQASAIVRLQTVGPAAEQAPPASALGIGATGDQVPGGPPQAAPIDPAAPAIPGQPLTVEQIKNMTAEQIADRYDEVQAVLKAGA